MAGRALKAAEKLAREGIDVEVINARFAKPVDEALLLDAARRHSRVVTVEENVLEGGFGDAVSRLFAEKAPGTRLHRIGLPDRFVEQAPRERLLSSLGLSVDALAGELARFFSSSSTQPSNP
jgi:1-deoxy-D-xylulose-5-phosphate synthase